MKKIAGAMLTFLVLSTNAQAALHITDFFQNGAQHRASDNSLDVLWNVNPAGGYFPIGDISSDTTLDVGDRLVTTLLFDQLTVPFPIGTTYNHVTDWDNEFTAVSVIEVVAKGVGGFGFTYAFAPPSTLDPLGLGWSAGTMVATYDDAANNYDGSPVSIPAGIADASGGTAYWEFGFAGGAGEFWSATTASDDLSVLGATPAGTLVGSFGLALNVTDPNSAPATISFTSTPDVRGTGLLTAPGTFPTVGGFHLIDDVNLFFEAEVVPEPASIVCWGGLLIGALGLVMHRRK